ncbi:MAG: hypothetical protein ACM31M_05945 [Nitrososphaerota archaeon]
MDVRIFLIGIAIVVVVSGGTGVLAQSNTTGNNTDVGSAEELEKLTSNNSLFNLSDTGTNQSSNQTSNQTSNMSG